jgi:chitodextrinase
MKTFSTRAAAVSVVLLVALMSLSGVRAARAATVAVSVDGGQRLQTMSGLGADINPNSWDNGNLKPALDLLVDQEGMKTFRVGMDMIDWESTNDDADPNTFNWSYYDGIYSGGSSFDTQYAGSNFANTWAVIDYLHQKGIPDSGIELSFMGIGPSWMGGATLTAGMEAEYAEEILSAADYGYAHGHTFGLLSPDNEMDISANEGVHMSDTQYASVLNLIAGRLDALGMGGVRLVGPETCCNVGYANPMKTSPTVMAKLAHFTFHNYNGTNDGAAAAVAGTGKDFWTSEYNSFDQSFTYLDNGAAGLMMWEAYDSVYNHAVLNGHGRAPGNDSLSFGNTPLLAYNATTKTYSPRSQFFSFGQLFKWVPLGAQRIGASSNTTSIKIEAFQDPATSRLTLVGQNTSSSAQPLNLSLANLPAPTFLQYFQTNSASNMAQGSPVVVSGGAATITVPGTTTFTLTGLGVSDTVAPSAPSSLSATGGVGSAVLTWTASTDNVGVSGYNVYRSTTSGFTPSSVNKIGQSTTGSYTDSGLTPGTSYYLVTAQDAAGNVSAPSNEASATVAADTTPPTVSISSPTGGTVSGTVTVSANAADNVGLAGVQFKVDGINLGAEVTGAPFSISWNTTTVANGSHTLTAVARDAAGNTATSSAVAVTTSNAATGAQLLGSNTVQGSGDNNAAGEAEAFKFTATASGQAGTLSFYADSGSAASTLKVGVYSDSSGKPGALLASGSLSSPRASNWNAVMLTTNPTLNAGTAYWIAVLGTGGQLNYRDAATGTCSQSNSASGLSNLPATWSPGTSWPSCNVSAFVSATAADTTPPTASITSPTNGVTLSGQTNVAISAADNVGVTKVELYADGTLNATDTTSPYGFSIDTASFTNGSHQLTAKAYDAAGNVGTSAAVTVNVLNDTTAPSVPTGVSATAVDMTSATVRWTASTDNVGVAGYHVWRGGSMIATTTSTSYADTGLQPATAYSYTVTAFDAAGNESAQSSPPVAATTASDTMPPSAPSGLTQTDAAATTATLRWSASTDDVAVAGYDYYDAGGLSLGTTTGTSHTYTGLSCGNGYRVGVDAFDAAGNRSAVATFTLTTTACDSQAPTVSLTAPANGATVSGTISVAATASDNVGVAGVQFKLDGANLGAELVTAPYTTSWNTTTATAGTHTVTAVARDAAGNTTTSSAVTVTVNNTALPVTLEKQVTTHQSTTGTSITSPALTTSGPSELLVAFVSSDGPRASGGETFSTVTGGGLTWTLRKRVNTRFGTSEIWTTPAASVVTNITVKATRSSGSYTGSITVAAFQNASLTTIGATGGASASSGAPSSSLTATKTGSVVWGVGNDWDKATTRTASANQTLVDQFLASSGGDTYWVQKLNSPSTAGQTMTISDTAPTSDQWNLATIEILPAA